MITLHVVQYAAQECEWQMSGEMSVAWMIEGWQYAKGLQSRPIKLTNVLKLGHIVEPRFNLNGLRTVGVRVGFDIKLDPKLVPSALNSLLKNQPILPASNDDATEWFRQYEEIHPFGDGNGRTGSLFYNWLLGTLAVPIHVPNLWDDPRRDLV